MEPGQGSDGAKEKMSSPPKKSLEPNATPCLENDLNVPKMSSPLRKLSKFWNRANATSLPHEWNGPEMLTSLKAYLNSVDAKSKIKVGVEKSAKELKSMGGTKVSTLVANGITIGGGSYAALKWIAGKTKNETEVAENLIVKNAVSNIQGVLDKHQEKVNDGFKNLEKKFGKETNSNELTTAAIVGIIGAGVIGGAIGLIVGLVLKSSN